MSTAKVINFEEFKRTHHIASKETLLEYSRVNMSFPFFIPFVGWTLLSYEWKLL